MQTCPRCGWIVADANARFCPNCGLTLQAPAESEEGAPATAYSALPSAPVAPPNPAPPVYGAPPSMPAPPVYGAPPSMPAPSGPTYGTGYGYPGGYPGGYTGAYAPGQGWRPSQQPEPRPWGRIIASIFGGVIVVAIIVSVMYSVTRPHQPPARLTVAQITQSAVSASTILADPLTTNENGWADDGNRCYFDTDGYHIRNNTICYAPIGPQVDGTESVTAKEISGPLDHGYGLVFRRVSKGNYYEFVITSSGDFGVFKFQNDILTELAPYTPSTAIDVGLNSVNTLSVTMNGPVFDCYVNGVKVTEVRDSAFPEGDWGLGAHSTVNVVFTDYLARR